MAISAPGGISWVWALVYIAVGMYVIPMILGFVANRKSAKDGG